MEEVYSHASVLRGWAHGYMQSFAWALAPVWEQREDGGCACPEGGECLVPGKHLVVDLGQAKSAEDVDRIWSEGDSRVTGGRVGIAAMTGPDSGLLVLDVEHPEDRVLAAQMRLDGDVLAQHTPSGGAHWCFRLGAGELVKGAGRGVDLDVWPGARVVGDGSFIVLAPRDGYGWSGGAEALRKQRGWREMPGGLRRVLEQKGLLTAAGVRDMDDPWLTAPGVPLFSLASALNTRSLSKKGCARRLVDLQGHRIALTPETGYRVWTESGWRDGARAEQELASFLANDVQSQVTGEARALDAAGDGRADRYHQLAGRLNNQGMRSVLEFVVTDERIKIPSEDQWDTEGWICGLPVVRGRGWLLNLRTGEIEHDARSRRVTGQLGAEWSGWSDGERAWKASTAVRRIMEDLEAAQGADWIRLLQRALAVSLLGRNELLKVGGPGAGDAFYVLQGPTRSGKSTVLELFLEVAGTYGKTMSQNLLFGDRGNPDFNIAAIHGKRVLLQSEPPLGAPLNPTMLKSLSGGDTLTGRMPYGKSEITFRSEASIWIATNHPLTLGDDALWERLRLFEFETQWIDGREDPTLRQRAVGDAGERAATLWWLMAGLRDWWEEGWGDQGVWRSAREGLKLRNDPMARWIAGGGVVVTGAAGDEAALGTAVNAFRAWAYAEAEDAVLKAETGVLTEELKHRLLRAGMTWDSRRRMLRGGRLT